MGQNVIVTIFVRGGFSASPGLLPLYPLAQTFITRGNESPSTRVLDEAAIRILPLLLLLLILFLILFLFLLNNGSA